jgi:hypothetical protein
MFGTAHNGVLFLDELPEFLRLVHEYSLFNIQITICMHGDPFICHPSNKNYTKKCTGHKVCSIPFSLLFWMFSILEIHWRCRFQAPTKCWYIYTHTDLHCITLLNTNLHQHYQCKNPKSHNGMKFQKYDISNCSHTLCHSTFYVVIIQKFHNNNPHNSTATTLHCTTI